MELEDMSCKHTTRMCTYVCAGTCGKDLLGIYFRSRPARLSVHRPRIFPTSTQYTMSRLRDEVLGNITGREGNGPIKTYIHKVYDWNDIQEAHRETEENKNIGKIIVNRFVFLRVMSNRDTPYLVHLPPVTHSLMCGDLFLRLSRLGGLSKPRSGLRLLI
ncbi:hypothetical protein IW261DRAFT_361493 [Armillaria novae-zelandiae]|uniref:Uncharacterized protein n=1 Tax=Armillaria novae-zelandiae TaxID=153914 RepID=A0AA39UM22_9AGAR|nr:hypothetical protein IW261DRAFT_361493 [Armillaria novae-zelandiae]